MDRIQLRPEQWYGWQILPGYGAESYEPYFSPILVDDLIPRKTGRQILTLKFFNAMYASGVQRFEIDLRVIKHSKNYMVCEFADTSPKERSGVISDLDFEWLVRFCPNFLRNHPPLPHESVSDYLNRVFLR